MSNGTTNVDQAFFYGMSLDPEAKGLNKGDAGKFEANIDPKALKEELDRIGSISIKLEIDKKFEKAAKAAKDKKDEKTVKDSGQEKEADDEITI